MKNLICKMFGHKLVHFGYTKMEWTNQGPALINPLRKPIKGKCFRCERCGDTLVHFEKLPTEKDILKNRKGKKKWLLYGK